MNTEDDINALIAETELEYAQYISDERKVFTCVLMKKALEELGW